MNYMINISFDGSGYSGWQRLKENDNTIQGKIENCLTQMCGRKITVDGCGRTDAGVHAYNYVVSFLLPEEKEPCEIKSYLNRYLPKDINVSECKRADERFHARLNVRKKTYCYRIWNSEEHNVFNRRYMYEFDGTLDVEKMEEAAKLFCGTFDFAGFSTGKKTKKSTVRTIFSVEIKKLGSEIQIEYTGTGFLYNMVRIMTGTLIEIGNGKRVIESINEIFETGKRELAGYTVPAKGLFLKEVIY